MAFIVRRKVGSLPGRPLDVTVANPPRMCPGPEAPHNFSLLQDHVGSGAAVNQNNLVASSVTLPSPPQCNTTSIRSLERSTLFVPSTLASNTKAVASLSAVTFVTPSTGATSPEPVNPQLVGSYANSLNDAQVNAYPSFPATPSSSSSPSSAERRLESPPSSVTSLQTLSTPSSMAAPKKRGRPPKNRLAGPELPSTSASGKVKRKPGRSSTKHIAATQTPSSPALEEKKRGPGRPPNPKIPRPGKGKSAPGCSLNSSVGHLYIPVAVASLSSTEDQLSHLYEKPLEIAGPGDPDARLRGGHRRKKPQPKKCAKRRIREQAAREARLKRLPSPEPAPAITCEENPNLFSCEDLVEALSMDKPPLTVHSTAAWPCANHIAHPQPHSVCANCRYRAMELRRQKQPNLTRNNLFGLCNTCGSNAMQNAEVIIGDNGELVGRAGCSCETAWLCDQCQLAVYEKRAAHIEADKPFRRSILGGAIADAHTRFMLWGRDA